MISSANYKKVRINITTYKNEESNKTKQINMNTDKCTKRPKTNNFRCSICLNSKNELDMTSKACPICQKNCDYCKQRDRDRNVGERQKRHETKSVQTAETDLPHGLTLLNEVLTVFQSKKDDFNKVKSKIGFKDAGVSTESKNNIKSNLTVNSFQFSIDATTRRHENGRFTIVNSSQPIFVRKSLYSIDLFKHKSSSIPQMKMEELKYSLKEKTKSKDAIEEVNRMFATVRKNDSTEHTNRPVVRNGPRVLPVVKSSNLKTTKIVENDCQCCQAKYLTQEHCNCKLDRLSSGDSVKTGSRDNDKCLYMMCCHYKNHYKTHTGMMICERCKNEGPCYVHEDRNDDSC